MSDCRKLRGNPRILLLPALHGLLRPVFYGIVPYYEFVPCVPIELFGTQNYPVICGFVFNILILKLKTCNCQEIDISY
jgi:hypothetical protein